LYEFICILKQNWERRMIQISNRQMNGINNKASLPGPHDAPPRKTKKIISSLLMLFVFGQFVFYASFRWTVLSGRKSYSEPICLSHWVTILLFFFIGRGSQVRRGKSALLLVCSLSEIEIHINKILFCENQNLFIWHWCSAKDLCEWKWNVLLYI